MAPSVKPEQIPHILTGDEWEALQYAPHRYGQDPTKPMPPGRILTGDEWEAAQRSSNPSALSFPALPKITAAPSDATKRLNPNAGARDQSIASQIGGGNLPGWLGSGIREGAQGLDAAAMGLGGTAGAAANLGASFGREVAAPLVEHPAITAALANPVGAVVGATMMAKNVAQYGWQYAHEQMMTPEERAVSEKDPNRISGESAAWQALFLGLGGIAGVKAVQHATDFSGGMVEAGADAIKPYYFEVPKGAEVLGTAAANHGLPETANPYPPGSNTGAAWRDGYASTKPVVRIPGTVEQTPTVAPAAATVPTEATPPTATEPAPAAPVAPAEATPAAPSTEPTTSLLAPIEGTGETVPRGSSQSIETKAVEHGLVQSLGQLPQYERANMAEHAARAVQLLADDPARARRIALGDEPAPEGMLPEAVSIAVENKALAEGDVATIRDIASGKLTGEATTMGQRIRTLGERNPESPVDAIQSVEEKRSGGQNAMKAIKATVKELQTHLKATGEINSDVLAKFIDSLRC